MPRVRGAFRLRRRGLLAVLFVFALAAAALPLLLRTRPEHASTGVPEPIFPFGSASRAALSFRWALPADDAPVRVELFDATRTPLWKSGTSLDGSLRPAKADLERWPAGDLLWRPVAVPAGSAERPGDLAAFALSP